MLMDGVSDKNSAIKVWFLIGKQFICAEKLISCIQLCHMKKKKEKTNGYNKVFISVHKFAEIFKWVCVQWKRINRLLSAKALKTPLSRKYKRSSVLMVWQLARLAIIMAEALKHTARAHEHKHARPYRYNWNYWNRCPFFAWCYLRLSQNQKCTHRCEQ